MESGQGQPLMGEPMRSHFLLEEDTAFVNHGSYGAAPRQVLEARAKMLQQLDSHPDRWFRSDLEPLYKEALGEVAEFVGAQPDNIVFVTNATSAVNAVLKGLRLNKGDVLLVTEHTYPACRLAAEAAAERYGANLAIVPITLPVTEEGWLADLEKTLLSERAKGGKVRLALLDHISSPSALVFPISKAILLLHSYEVEVLVDGAHAPGQIDLNLEMLDADYYTGNLHKWCYAPRSAAFLWVATRHRETVRPLVTSHLHRSSMNDQFFMQGTMDHTPYLSTRPALQFYRWLGGLPGLHAHVTPLLDWAEEMLCCALGTQPLPAPQSMKAPWMRVVGLPSLPPRYALSREAGIAFMKDLYTEHRVVAAVVVVAKRPWLRISGNCYSTKQDFIKLKDAVLTYL